MANWTIRELKKNDVRFDLAPRIFTNASEFCPVTAYKIDHVVDQFSGKKFSRHW